MRSYLCPQCGGMLETRPYCFGRVRAPWITKLVCTECGYTLSAVGKLLIAAGVLGLAAVVVLVLASLIVVALVVALPVLITLATWLFLYRAAWRRRQETDQDAVWRVTIQTPPLLDRNDEND